MDGGAPANLITMVEEPSIENTNRMIDHPGVRLLVATGGPAIVKKVLSSGKKAIGAGAGDRRYRKGSKGHCGRLQL